MQPSCSLPIVCTILVIAAIVGTFFWGTLSKEKAENEASPAEFSQVPETPQVKIEPPSIPAVEQVLQRYGSEDGTLKEDLTLFKNYLSNVFILAKQRDSRHYATNEDLVLFLTGKHGNLTPYLSADSKFLSSENQFLDRYGSPLIVHALSTDQLEIRSSGPDLIPYNEDDIVL